MLTLSLIAITCLVSISAFSNRDLFAKFLFNAPLIRTGKQWHRFITHALVHADEIHLAMNMIVLYMFGSKVEEELSLRLGDITGPLYFFFLYFTGIIASSYPSYLKHKEDHYYNSVGASGAVSAVVFSAILLDPWSDMGLMFIPVFVPAPVFGALYLVYCWYAAKHARDNVAHDVHYWGSLFGVLFTVVILPETVPQFIEAVRNLLNY